MAQVTVEENALLVEGYKNADHNVVAHFRRVPEGEGTLALNLCLAVGVSVLAVAGPTLDADLVRREFDAVVERQHRLIEEAGEAVKAEIISSLEPMLGEGGSVSTVFKAVEQELRKYFDKDSAHSIASTVSKALEEPLRASERRAERSLREALNVTDENAGLGAVLKTIRKEGEETGRKLADLMARVSGLVERRDERGASTQKGGDFEQAVFEEVARLAQLHGDSAEPTGAATGEARKKRGDIVVTVSPAMTHQNDVRVVLEAMDRTAISQKAALQELQEAMENRIAVAAIAVLSSRQAPAACQQPIQRCPGNRYIVVLDKETWDKLALEVAYWAARVEALKSIAPNGTPGVDLEAVSGLVEEAIGHLGDLAKLRARLSAGRSAISDAESITSELEGKLTRCLSKASAYFSGELAA